MLCSFLKRLALMLCTGIAFTVQGHAATLSGNAFDDRAAVIFTYFAIGNDDNPAASITADQFTAQMEELSSPAYHILPLPEIAAALKAGRKLPDRTIAITFDGADKSVLTAALPLLRERKIPFTVFIPEGPVSAAKPPYMTWDDLRALKATGLVTFGLHPASYTRLAGSPEAEIRRQINNSLDRIRKELDVKADLIAYPFGDYDTSYKTIVSKMGLKAAFGQQSGVAHAGEDFYALPRFSQTERFADLERFSMSANALPFPARDISPASPHLSTMSPAIGFTVPEKMAKSLKDLSCFSSSTEKPDLELLGNRVELRLKSAFGEDRPRINCTLPVAAEVGEEPRWRWFGMLFTATPDLLEKAQAQTISTARHAADDSDSVNIE